MRDGGPISVPPSGHTGRSFDLKFIRPGEQHIQVAPFWLDATEASPGSSQAIKLEPGETKEGVEFQTKRD
jgi:hypothetical protein